MCVCIEYICGYLTNNISFLFYTKTQKRRKGKLKITQKIILKKQLNMQTN